MPSAAKRHRPMQPIAPRHKVPERDRQAGRQYATNSKTWRAMRAMVLAEEPLCRICAPRLTAATVVDHMDGDSWNNSRENLQALCASCHSAKTAREDGGYGNRRA